MDIFEKAAQQKLRFDTKAGALSAEDLFDLPLTSPSGKQVNLNDLAKGLNREIKARSDDQDFVETSKPAGQTNTALRTKFDIVLRVIEIKKAERDEAKNRADLLAHRQKLMALLAEKDEEALSGKSREEIQKMLDETPVPVEA